ncbi:SusC/RagA family TonB-linked outer membrane protein [Olivibacter jilunii]|uniref:SusC/RagA family TonB-linked outer membrane protein n=1 Tax=Olivibacter jilunii TaxID=985016 RepID=UPI0010324157|nr:SusC/RagA family TonB-linked outer membrane protein [Olivibacter jilunii]
MNNKIVMEEVCPASTSLLVGFGDSCDLGRDSIGTRGELHGEISHRVHLQCRSSWLAGERTGRREVGRAKVIQRALKPYTIYLTALNVLFCVCLAHARQFSSPEAAHGVAFQSRYPITGMVLNAADDTPLDGATISIKGRQNTVLTNAEGKFRILATDSTGVLMISYVGYQTAEIPFTNSNNNPLTIRLESNGTQLEEVQVSTGYQTLPKERATGSFVQIDSTLLHRSVSTNILDRLEGVTNGLIFNKSLTNQGNNAGISIRGRSTLFANPEPLIVVDNFPYDGDISNINPADIESITVLKDAAAASIWGVRAGNGVIVITTRKGKYDVKPVIAFTSNFTFKRRPDQYYLPRLSSAEYIDVEQYLFERGAYNTIIGNGYGAISEVVDILNRKTNGDITEMEAVSAINVLRNQDNRGDISKYLFRESFFQQYQANMSGGGRNNRYFISAAYDNNKGAAVSDQFERVTIMANNTFRVKDRLELFTGLTFTNSLSNSNSNPYSAFTPYERFMDEEGNSLPVFGGRQLLRKAYVDTVGGGDLLDWNYRPLDERYANVKDALTDYRVNVNIKYRLLDGLDISTNYQYEKADGVRDNLNTANSFFTRDIINTFSQGNEQTGEIRRIIPLGDILERRNNAFASHYGRFQLNFNKKIHQNHDVTALAGFEIKNYKSSYDSNTLYGYDRPTASNQNASINFTALYPLYYNPVRSGRIPFEQFGQWTLDRYVSYYFNASYGFKNRYIFSLSARKDQSNLFGVDSNQKGVPLWSTGFLYKLSDEPFYPIPWLAKLALRATFGYNGNVDKSVSALFTSTLFTYNMYNALYARVVNPPNPSLRWEKVANVNIGLDFALKSNKLSGSIEYYQKKGLDLIGSAMIAPQTGISSFRGNTANIITRGVDLMLHANVIDRIIRWDTDFLLTHVKDKVTKYDFRQSTNLSVVRSNPQNPMVGYPYYGLFGFVWGGLNGEGNPVGLIENTESTNYAAILNSTNTDELVYVGNATPTFFGSLRNSFSFKRATLSVNITYKLGYFFRRSSINYSALLNGGINAYQQADFASRWLQPGDEQHTTVPAFVYPANTNRDNFYQYSTALIEKADHIRLQDVQLSYLLKIGERIPMKNVRLVCYARNLGIIWKSTRYSIDPDYSYGTGMPDPFSVSIGINFNI